MKEFKLSVLDLAPIKEGSSVQDALSESMDLAKYVESLGYHRYWLAEHHNFEGIASSATSVLIGYIASGTKTMRVGSGGVMLPNHSSLVIAEQFGTLDALYPNRIDLGVGRAPGTDGYTAKALGRNPMTINTQFPKQIHEVQTYFSPANKGALVRAIPGEGSNVPIYMLGSSTDSAYLAAELGLPYAFAGHFAPEMMERAFKIYHERFEPSAQLEKPYTLACVNGMAAETDEEAQKISSTLYLTFLGLIRNERRPYAKPVDDMDAIWSPQEKIHLMQKLKYSFIGSKESVKSQVTEFQKRFNVDEIMINSAIFDATARKESYRILQEVVSEIHN